MNNWYLLHPFEALAGWQLAATPSALTFVAVFQAFLSPILVFFAERKRHAMVAAALSRLKQLPTPTLLDRLQLARCRLYTRYGTGGYYFMAFLEYSVYLVFLTGLVTCSAGPATCRHYARQCYATVRGVRDHSVAIVRTPLTWYRAFSEVGKEGDKKKVKARCAVRTRACELRVCFCDCENLCSETTISAVAYGTFRLLHGGPISVRYSGVVAVVALRLI